jgi:hypothetical protein
MRKGLDLWRQLGGIERPFCCWPSCTASSSKAFRLAFDNVPEGWNQAMPTMVIARIDFS